MFMLLYIYVEIYLFFLIKKDIWTKIFMRSKMTSTETIVILELKAQQYKNWNPVEKKTC